MSVTNKKIRELESAAIDAAHAIDDLIEQLEGGGSTFLRDQRIANRVERLRLAAIELDRAETACSRERTLTMSEEEMREEFEALGLDWDETTERGHALLQRLLAEHDARREAEIAAKAGELAAGMGVGLEDAADKISTGFKLPDAPAEPQPRGLKLTVLDVPPDTSGPMPFVRRPDPQLLDLPIGHPSGGLGDGGKSELSYWYDLIEKVEPDPDWAEAMTIAQADAARGHVDVPPDPSGEAVVRLDDGDITRLLADQIAEEFGVDLHKLENIPRATLLRLHAELGRARRLRLPRVALAPQILDIIGRQPRGAVGEKLAELAIRPGHAVREPGESEAEYISRLRTAYADDDESTWEISEGIRLVRGTPIQVALGSAMPKPGEDMTMVVIIGYVNAPVAAFWVSDHGLEWLRGAARDEKNEPVVVTLLHQDDVERGRWDLTPEVDAALAKHFEGVDPLSAKVVAAAEERGRRARGHSL